jgi:hypothetical protein
MGIALALPILPKTPAQTNHITSDHTRPDVGRIHLGFLTAATQSVCPRRLGGSDPLSEPSREFPVIDMIRQGGGQAFGDIQSFLQQILGSLRMTRRLLQGAQIA